MVRGGRSTGAAELTNVYYYNVIDGSDSTAGAVCTTSSCVRFGLERKRHSLTNSGDPLGRWMTAARWPTPLFTHTSQGCQAGRHPGLIHDNFFNFIFEPGYSGHGNVIETLSQSTGSFTAYNNITRNINEGENWNPSSQNQTIYNNVWENDQHFPPDPNCLLMEPFGNNTMESLRSTSSTTQ